jgi:signal transduction histidine kinase
VYTDNGKGIESAYLDKIFDMFFRASADSYGSGLGLYITRQVVKKLNGTIRVQSEPGQGTEFVITLPNLHVAAAAPALPLATP